MKSSLPFADSTPNLSYEKHTIICIDSSSMSDQTSYSVWEIGPSGPLQTVSESATVQKKSATMALNSPEESTPTAAAWNALKQAWAASRLCPLTIPLPSYVCGRGALRRLVTLEESKNIYPHLFLSGNGGGKQPSSAGSSQKPPSSKRGVRGSSKAGRRNSRSIWRPTPARYTLWDYLIPTPRESSSHLWTSQKPVPSPSILLLTGDVCIRASGDYLRIARLNSSGRIFSMTLNTSTMSLHTYLASASTPWSLSASSGRRFGEAWITWPPFTATPTPIGRQTGKHLSKMKTSSSHPTITLTILTTQKTWQGN